MAAFENGYRVEASRFYYDYADGLAIVIDSATGTYYGMNVLGSAVFDQLAKGSAPAAVLEQLRQMRGCPSEIDALFARFFSQLIDFGLLISGETGRLPEPFDERVAAEGFVLEVKEFAEIQEILLADPIHDVHSDFGWPSLKN